MFYISHYREKEKCCKNEFFLKLNGILNNDFYISYRNFLIYFLNFFNWDFTEEVNRQFVSFQNERLFIHTRFILSLWIVAYKFGVNCHSLNIQMSLAKGVIIHSKNKVVFDSKKIAKITLLVDDEWFNFHSLRVIFHSKEFRAWVFVNELFSIVPFIDLLGSW